ncbi:MAG: bifunctional diaminohydroxyphosphoribosylaminopyrimidine deaminase/5-amino-6-(5-phosphoribosylamino)uracil reductase RibD [Candidatus Omnitrophota bacterium]
MTDLDYMKKAFQLSLRAKGETWPNPVVGAVIVKNGKIISEGHHRYCGSDHAEVVALKKAGNKARSAKLYVTLEPCSHFGRTPPCVDAIIQSGIKEAIFAVKDPNPINSGKSIQKLKQAGIKVRFGFLEKEVFKANEPFFKYIKTKMPFVTAKIAQTLDGKIAASNGRSQWITSKEARDYAHRLRQEFDAILVGVNTVLADDPRLSAVKKFKQIKKIIVDTHLRTPERSRIFKNTLPSDVIIATTKKSSLAKRNSFLKRGVDIVICPTKNSYVDIKWLFKRLTEREIVNLLIEGGGRIIGSALRENLVDRMLVFIAPKILGDTQAISSACGLTARHVDDAIKLRDLSVKKIGQDILLEAYVHRDR